VQRVANKALSSWSSEYSRLSSVNRAKLDAFAQQQYRRIPNGAKVNLADEWDRFGNTAINAGVLTADQLNNLTAANVAAARQAGLTKTQSALVPFRVLDKQGNVKRAFLAEIADTNAARTKGMAKYASTPLHGMFFDIPGPFWMKGVNYPLDVAFLDKKGCIVDLQHMPVSYAPDFLKARYSSRDDRAVYSMEMPAGWFKQAQVVVGDTITTDHLTKQAISPIMVRRALRARHLRELLGKYTIIPKLLEAGPQTPATLFQASSTAGHTPIYKQILRALDKNAPPMPLRPMRPDNMTNKQTQRIISRLLGRELVEAPTVRQRLMYILGQGNLPMRPDLTKTQVPLLDRIRGALRAGRGDLRLLRDTKMRGPNGEILPILGRTMQIRDGNPLLIVDHPEGGPQIGVPRPTGPLSGDPAHKGNIRTKIQLTPEWSTVLSGRNETPNRIHLEALSHRDYPRLSGSLMSQYFDNMSPEEHNQLRARILARLHAAKVPPDSDSLVNILKHELHVPQLPANVMARLRTVTEAMPETSVITTTPGHTQVYGLYGSSGMVPTVGAYMALPTLRLPGIARRGARLAANILPADAQKRYGVTPKTFDALQPLRAIKSVNPITAWQQLQQARLEQRNAARQMYVNMYRDTNRLDAKRIYDWLLEAGDRAPSSGAAALNKAIHGGLDIPAGQYSAKVRNIAPFDYFDMLPVMSRKGQLQNMTPHDPLVWWPEIQASLAESLRGLKTRKDHLLEVFRRDPTPFTPAPALAFA
jgi:uncharacterized membrane protein (UPF0127 family)